MDLTAFSGTTFDAKEWANIALKSLSGGTDKEAGLTSLIAKLNVYYQQVNSEFEETTRSVTNNLPRVLHDIENISQEVITLKQKMGAVKQEIANVEKKTGASIASLEKIDNVKTQLVNAKQAMYEADNWTVLSTDIEAVFESGDIDLIASKLVSMQQSLNALSSASDYDFKKTQLEGLKNRLEALSSPHVVKALTSKSAGESKRFVKIFEDMGRFPLFVKYYSKCQKAGLIEQWEATVDTDSEETVVESLQNFYDFLITEWQEQVKWCADVMPQISPHTVLIDLYIDLLTSLSQEFARMLEDNIKIVDEPLPWLLKVKHAAKAFSGNLKMKVSNVTHANLLSLAKSVYLPLVQMISKYSSLQKSAFQQVLNSVTIQEDLFETVQTLGQKNTQVFLSIAEGRKLCIELTEGCSLPGFLSAQEWFIREYLVLYQKLSLKIQKTRVVDNDSSTFQMCVTTLQNLGDIGTSLKQIDQECVEIVQTIANTFKKNEKDPFSSFSALLLDIERQREFASLVQSVTDSTEPSVLKPCLTAYEALCREVYQTSLSVIFKPISVLLETVPSVPTWKSKAISSELPEYGFTPQEYITQIGQYLMNLPQMLEPFLSQDNPPLAQALSAVGNDLLTGEDAESSGFVELWLGKITESSSRAYADQILTINSLSSVACKQLATDINYLGNVVEDLGFALSDRLKSILHLLKLSPADYGTQSAGCPPQLVAAVRQMRNIISE